MDHKLVVDLISIPLFTGVIGYITNWTGVLMLFKPLRFHGVRVPLLRVLFPFLPRRVQVLPLIRYDGGLGWQGIVPSRADKMASIAVDKGLAKLGSIADFYRELEPDRIAEHLTAAARPEIRRVVEQVMQEENPQLWNDLPPVVREAVHARVHEKLPKTVKTITDEIGNNIDQLIDAKLMVIRYFVRHPELLNELFMTMGRKELRFMQNFGFYFGFPMGFLLVGLVHAYPHWWLLPLGGVVIGWIVNYIGTELLHGPRSDRTLQMLEDTLRPAIDEAAGRARAAVRLAIGTREYDNIRDSVAAEASTFAPVALSEPDFNRRQSENIYRFVATQMRGMGPDDFVEMLRSAIKQDEWLLFVHGGALGLVAGFVHLAIFGV